MSLIVVLALAGIVIGPWLGIIVDRAVERERLGPEHRCRACGAGLGAVSLIPVLSWFQRCPRDRGHARWAYPSVDLALAAVFALAGWRLGSSWLLVPYLALFAAFVVMAVIDMEHKLLLNVLTYPTLGLGLLAVLMLSGPQGYGDAVGPALIGALVYGGVLLLAFLVYPPGLGLGDVKLAPSLGLAMGWLAADQLSATRFVIMGLLIGFLSTAVIGLIYGAVSGQGRKAEVPAGPFLVFGALAVIMAADPSLGWFAGGVAAP